MQAACKNTETIMSAFTETATNYSWLGPVRHRLQDIKIRSYPPQHSLDLVYRLQVDQSSSTNSGPSISFSSFCILKDLFNYK